MDIATLWISQYPSLTRYIQRYTKNRAEAEDIAQSAYVRALENLQGIQEMSPPHARAWLQCTAYRIFIDEARRKQKQLPWDEDAQPVYEEDFAGIHVGYWLDRLPDNLRRIVVLRHLQGYSSREIGEKLSLTPPTVRTQLRAAMILLRQYEQEAENAHAKEKQHENIH